MPEEIRFRIQTLGCKVNLYESEAISYGLKKLGWQEAEDYVDVQILNTCTVTSTSDSKGRKMIRQMIAENPDAIMVVMGCYSQLAPEEVAKIQGVDIVIGTKYKNKVAELVAEFKKSNKQIIKVDCAEDFKCFEELELKSLSFHTRGFVKIQDGCNNFCSYCAIPYARGPIKSRSPESIIEEIKYLVDNNTKEIIISGINTGTYGQDLGNINLAGLIDKIMTEVPSLYRLRLSSIELMEITDELLATIKKYEKRVARHLHIPLQAGCDSTLKRMGRKYDMESYYNRINEIRSLMPGIAITTDCLAGFVGETKEEFNVTYQNVKTIGFAGVHVFPYSRRKGTKADQMDGHLAPSIIKTRANALGSLASELKLQYMRKYLGQVWEVLFEQEKNGYWYGHTSNYLSVKLKATGQDLTNVIKKIKLVNISGDAILGKE